MKTIKSVDEKMKIGIWSFAQSLLFLTIIYLIFEYMASLGIIKTEHDIYFKLFFVLLALTSILIYGAMRKIYCKYIEENNNLKVYVNTIDDFNDELRRFKHNYLNILSTLYGYIEDESNEELKRYFLDIVEQCKEVKDNNVSGLTNIKDVPLKSILAVKINEALRQNIFIQTYCDKNLDINGMKLCDLCEIMGVFLDNAIEECKTITDKPRKIIVCMVKMEDSIVVEIKNTYKVKPNIALIRYVGYSTKGKGRGFGVPSVMKILSKYGEKALLNTYLEEENEYFVQELSIKQ